MWVTASGELVQSSSALEEQDLSFNYHKSTCGIEVFLNTYHV